MPPPNLQNSPPPFHQQTSREKVQRSAHTYTTSRWENGEHRCWLFPQENCGKCGQHPHQIVASGTENVSACYFLSSQRKYSNGQGF